MDVTIPPTSTSATSYTHCHTTALAEPRLLHVLYHPSFVHAARNCHPPIPPCNSGFTTNRHPVRYYSRYSRRLTHPRPAQATPEGTVRLPAAVWPQDSPLQVMPNGITPLPQKVEAVREFLLLTTVIAVIVTDQGTYWI
ncbi:hypothetical protein Pmani_005109 [Petrolisthes manimaculis]|uniref:Uncharacterized protein n=1 Tax=Petrolisthes manimaculis TaxID=1843537 RepID=A0AAE1QCX4_9EUCA|nr:hypothetical protein Pmani_005109 [Petrolisthes manimaculis]